MTVGSGTGVEVELGADDNLETATQWPLNFFFVYVSASFKGLPRNALTMDAQDDLR